VMTYESLLTKEHKMNIPQMNDVEFNAVLE
jgi:hypothetical protein